jgi:hypothetical protein
MSYVTRLRHAGAQILVTELVKEITAACMAAPWPYAVDVP